jgi:hypothetical protein
MKLIYQNFDGLDVAFQGAFPEELLEILREAKDKAKQHDGMEILVHIGQSNMPVLVAGSGARGGYAYRFDTGPDGAIWFVAHSTKTDRWNIRVSLTSLNLALNGYEGARDNLRAQLLDFGAVGSLADLPLPASIGRADYCFDFIMDDFEPIPTNFVAHSRSTVASHEEMMAQVVRRGRKTLTITVGKMPNRQVTIYNKTREIVDHNKPYWWDIWGIEKETFQGQIFRVEVRAGKHELDQWNIKNFGQFEQKIGDVLIETLSSIKYTEPSDDENPSRWPLHQIWQSCLDAAKNALAPYSSNAERKKIITDLRENLVDRAQKNFRGSVATFNHLLGHSPEEVTQTLEVINDDVESFAKNQKEEFRKKCKKAGDKYVFLKYRKK